MITGGDAVAYDTADSRARTPPVAWSRLACVGGFVASATRTDPEFTIFSLRATPPKTAKTGTSDFPRYPPSGKKSRAPYVALRRSKKNSS